MIKTDSKLYPTKITSYINYNNMGHLHEGAEYSRIACAPV
jgi:hypothetical protein